MFHTAYSILCGLTSAHLPDHITRNNVCSSWHNDLFKLKKDLQWQQTYGILFSMVNRAKHEKNKDVFPRLREILPSVYVSAVLPNVLKHVLVPFTPVSSIYANHSRSNTQFISNILNPNLPHQEVSCTWPRCTNPTQLLFPNVTVRAWCLWMEK